jgi:hypothetical protein
LLLPTIASLAPHPAALLRVVTTSEDSPDSLDSLAPTSIAHLVEGNRFFATGCQLSNLTILEAFSVVRNRLRVRDELRDGRDLRGGLALFLKVHQYSKY